MRDVAPLPRQVGLPLIGAAIVGDLLPLPAGPCGKWCVCAPESWATCGRTARREAQAGLSAKLVMVDTSGALWHVASGTRSMLTKWGLERVCRIYASVDALYRAAQSGHCSVLAPGAGQRTGVPFKP